MVLLAIYCSILRRLSNTLTFQIHITTRDILTNTELFRMNSTDLLNDCIQLGAHEPPKAAYSGSCALDTTYATEEDILLLDSLTKGQLGSSTWCSGCGGGEVDITPTQFGWVLRIPGTRPAQLSLDFCGPRPLSGSQSCTVISQCIFYCLQLRSCLCFSTIYCYPMKALDYSYYYNHSGSPHMQCPESF